MSRTEEEDTAMDLSVAGSTAAFTALYLLVQSRIVRPISTFRLALYTEKINELVIRIKK